MDEVVRTCVGAGLSHVVARLRPLGSAEGLRQTITSSHWPTTFAELEAIQLELAREAMSVPTWRPSDGFLAGAAFAAPERGLQGGGAAGDRAWAAAVTMDGPRAVASVTIEGRFGAAYRPGYLALRVGPLLEAAGTGAPAMAGCAPGQRHRLRSSAACGPRSAPGRRPRPAHDRCDRSNVKRWRRRPPGRDESQCALDLGPCGLEHRPRHGVQRSGRAQPWEPHPRTIEEGTYARPSGAVPGSRGRKTLNVLARPPHADEVPKG